MILDRNILEIANRTKKTLYIVTGVYVAVGFMLAGSSALAGDRLGTFLGFVIISGALATAVLVRALLRISVRVYALRGRLDEIRTSLDRIERAQAATAAGPTHLKGAAESEVIDLAAFGHGDPSALTAATLDRSVFPRLATLMDELPHLDRETHVRSTTSGERTASAMFVGSLDRAAEPRLARAGVTAKNLPRIWRAALREGDLLTCREVLSAAIDTAPSDLVSTLTAQLNRLKSRTERKLRARFARAAAKRDILRLLAIGDEICALLPDRPVADEFRRLEPALRRQLARQSASGNWPLKVAH